MSVLLFISVRNSQINLETQIVNRVSTIADSKKVQLEQYFENNIDVIKVIASRTALAEKLALYNEKPSAGLQETLSISLLDSLNSLDKTNVESISFIDLRGVTIASTNQSEIGTNLSSDPLFTEGESKAGAHFTKDSGITKISFVSPILLKDKLIGVARSIVNTEQIEGIAAGPTELGETEEVLLAVRDKNDNPWFIINRKFESQAVSNSSDAIPMRTALRGVENTFNSVNDYRGVPVIAATRYFADLNAGLVVKIDTKEANAPLRNVLITTIVISLFGVFLAILVARLLSDTLSAPIKKLTEITKKFAESKSQLMFPDDLLAEKDEIGTLSLNFKTMMDTVSSSYQATKEAEEQLEAMSSSMQDALIMMDDLGNIRYWNPAAKTIFGYEKNEVMGKNLHELLSPPRYHNDFRNAFKEFQRSGKGATIDKTTEAIGRRKDGTEFPIELSLSAIQIKGKWNSVGVIRDITERQKAEKKVLQLSELYAALSLCNQAIVHSDNKKELLMNVCRAAVDSGAFKMAWIGEADRRSNSIVPISSYGDETGYLQNIHVSTLESDPYGRGPTGVAFREAKPYWAQDFMNDPNTEPWHEEGKRAGWGSSAALPIYQKGEVMYAITLYTTDVSGFDDAAKSLLIEMASDISFALDNLIDRATKKEAEENLIQTNQQLQKEKEIIEAGEARDKAIMASIGEGLVAVNKEGNFIAVNKKATELLGWDESEILGKPVMSMIHILDEEGKDTTQQERPIFIAINTGKPFTTSTMRMVKKNGNSFPIAATATPVIINDEIVGAVVVFRDITKDKEIEKTRGDLLALASHQLRTPLSGTKWLIETLQRGIKGSLNKDQNEYLDELYKINQRMTTLVGDMLGVLRMEEGSITTNKTIVSTTTLFETILETMAPVAKSKGITIKQIADTEHKIETDPLLLRNIVECFVSNALNYSNKGGEVLLSIKEQNDELIIAVKDSGIGIPKDEQRQLFERFYRASNAKTFNTQGTGLGLYIAAIIAKKIGVRLTFESTVGKGSIFYVHIPYSPTDVLHENATRV